MLPSSLSLDSYPSPSVFRVTALIGLGALADRLDFNADRILTGCLDALSLLGISTLSRFSVKTGHLGANSGLKACPSTGCTTNFWPGRPCSPELVCQESSCSFAAVVLVSCRCNVGLFPLRFASKQEIGSMR